jgi:hypothetical protein
MPKTPIKFRCVQCNQLLGVSPSRIGSVISCPRCAVELIVPEADAPPEVPRAAEPEPIPAILSSLVLDRPDPLAELRPEDIRVEPGLPEPARARRPPRPIKPAPAPAPEPEPEPPTPEPPPLVLTPEALAGPPNEAPAGPEEGVLPPIQTEPVAVRPSRPTARARDITLPRSVVTAWSLFVLLALGMAFAAGLLAGHFLWRVR